MTGISLADDGEGIRVRIPMKMRKRGGRKQIVVPGGLEQAVPSPPDYQEAFVIALAKAHRWLELLESGRYRSITEMAETFGVNNAYMRRLLRFTLLAPDIIVAILGGREPDGFSQNMLVGAIPADWSCQRDMWRFAETRSSPVASPDAPCDLSN